MYLFYLYTYVLWVNSIYKINRYIFLVVEFKGVIIMNKNFNVGFVFLRDEKEKVKIDVWEC